jgi:hypothetical protein
MRIAMVVMALALAGCTQVWNRPGAGQADLERDGAYCRMVAAGIQAPASQPLAYPQGITMATSANNLNAASAAWVGVAMKQQVMADCLRSKGWVQE